MLNSKIFEVVKTLELEPILSNEGRGEPFKYRIEILKEMGADNCFARVYRRETYRLNPTFGQGRQIPTAESADQEIEVKDDFINTFKMTGTNVEEVMNSVIRRISEIFKK